MWLSVCVCDCTAFQLRKHKTGPCLPKQVWTYEQWGVNTLTNYVLPSIMAAQWTTWLFWTFLWHVRSHSAFVTLMNIRVGSIIHWRGRVPSTLAWKQIIFHSFRHDHQQKKLQKTHLYVSIWQCKYLVIILLFFLLPFKIKMFCEKKEKQTLGSVSHIFKKTTPIKNGWHSISSNMTKHHINPKTHTLSAHCVPDGSHQLFHSCMHSHFLYPSIFEMHHSNK